MAALASGQMVLERVMRWQAVAFFVTMIIGAAAYDKQFIQWILVALGIRWNVTPEMAMRFPIYLTLGNAVLALWVALNLREPQRPACIIVHEPNNLAADFCDWSMDRSCPVGLRSHSCWNVLRQRCAAFPDRGQQLLPLHRGA